MMADDDPRHASLIARFDAFATMLDSDVGEHAVVERERLDDGAISVWITPERPGALAVSWSVQSPDGLVLCAGHHGGRWELTLVSDDVDLVQNLTRAIIKGHVTEVFAWRRSRVSVTVGDGTVVRETGGTGVLSLLPLPGWPSWGQQVQYTPYL